MRTGSTTEEKYNPREIFLAVFLMINSMNHDITHCSGEGCPKRHKCYRFHAYEEYTIEPRQIFIEPPYKEGECKFFVED